MSGRVPNPIKIFHITHGRNLQSILKNKGLYAYNALKQKSVGYEDISYGDVQEKRARTIVIVPPGGSLHDYVPFYFAPQSPMLYTINQGNVEQYHDGQPPIIYLATTVDCVEQLNLTYAFSDGHGIIRISRFFNQRNDFNKVDWDIMEAQYWADTDLDNDRSRRRQAEFLVHNYFPWEAVMFIGTYNEAAARRVHEIIKNEQHQPQVECRREWYY